MKFECLYDSGGNYVQTLDYDHKTKDIDDVTHTLIDLEIGNEDAGEMVPMLNNIHDDDKGQENGYDES